ncbi:MAG: preprotein translocase subunit SecE [Planctomycetota bacterium]|nr:preprotein translocase subunit SecE [Planctomycetota bacterium]
MAEYFQELFHVGIYKRTQGRIARQVTFATLAIVFAYGLWQLSDALMDEGHLMQFALPGLLLLVCLWVTYRLVNVPSVADFLIAVEAEMNKVSWPTRQELFRGSTVVLITIILLAAVLFGFDMFWNKLFTQIGIL